VVFSPTPVANAHSIASTHLRQLFQHQPPKLEHWNVRHGEGWGAVCCCAAAAEMIYSDGAPKLLQVHQELLLAIQFGPVVAESLYILSPGQGLRTRAKRSGEQLVGTLACCPRRGARDCAKMTAHMAALLGAALLCLAACAGSYVRGRPPRDLCVCVC
jgi:hypothetical protein